jgi:hypothetical protein
MYHLWKRYLKIDSQQKVAPFGKGVTFEIVEQPRLTGSVGQEITRIFILSPGSGLTQ